MSSRKRPRKVQQQRLTFEPVAAVAGSSSSPLHDFGRSPARVRFSSPGQTHESSPSKKQMASPSSVAPMGGKKRRPRQQTLESSLIMSGKERVNVKPRQISQMEDDDGDGLPHPSATRNSLTQEHRRQAAMSPPRSSMFGAHKGRRQVVVDSDSETPVEEDGAVTDSDGEGPLKQETPRRDRPKPRHLPHSVVTISSNEGDGDEDDSQEEEEEEVVVVVDSENEVRVNVRSSQSLSNLAAPEDDDDDLPMRTPRSSMPRPRGRQDSDADEDEDEDEDEVIQTPAKRRRLTRHKAAPAQTESDSDAPSADSSPVTLRSNGRGKSKASSSPPASTARSMRSGARRHRTQREKRIELLKRHRAGERHLNIEDINTSEEEVDGALYDTDSDHQVLDVFEDESETEEPAPQTGKKKNKSKKKEKKSQRAREASVLDEDADSEDENFIDDDDDTLGVPDEALHLIPLEFTRASTKPLKLHFKDAVEWLIHRRINPGFDKDNEVYVTAWRKLSDEVTGLANSKFISSVWRPDFHKALKARPYIEQEELGVSALASEFENCQACGRSGHPATWTIRPWGKPYDPKTLDEVDSNSDDEDEDDDDDNDDEEHGDRDTNGNIIPSEDTRFFVGQTCNSNAETAHSLMHWRVGLRDWVEAHLEGEGYFAADQVLRREKMKAKARHRVADQIVADWDENGTIQGLFGDFQQTIENARNKDPTKVARGRRW